MIAPYIGPRVKQRRGFGAPTPEEFITCTDQHIRVPEVCYDSSRSRAVDLPEELENAQRHTDAPARGRPG